MNKPNDTTPPENIKTPTRRSFSFLKDIRIWLSDKIRPTECKTLEWDYLIRCELNLDRQLIASKRRGNLPEYQEIQGRLNYVRALIMKF